MLMSHFTFTLLVPSFLITYIVIRLNMRRGLPDNHLIDKGKKFLSATLLIIGINMVLILPLTLALNAVSIELQEGMTLASLLTLCIKGLFPPINETFKGSLSLFPNNVSFVPLYQSVLVILMLPQFVKLIDKGKRRIIICSYIITLLTVFITQSVEMVNVTSLAPLNTNIISIALILFNALIVAYVFNDFKNIDRKLLSQTCRVFKMFLLVVLSLIFIFEIFLKYSGISQLTWSEVIDELVALSPYFMLCLMMIGLINLYRFILFRLASEHEIFSWKTIFIFFKLLNVLVLLTSTLQLMMNNHQYVKIK